MPVGLVRIASVLLVDAGGALLLQLRESTARIDPGLWGLPGGHIDPGEDAAEAARRELREETGLVLTAPLIQFWHDVYPSRVEASLHIDWSVFYATTPAEPADLVLGAGDALAFTPPERALTLPLADRMTEVVPAFLASAQYRAICGRCHR